MPGFLSAGLGLLGSIGGSALKKNQKISKEQKQLQKQKYALINDLISGVKGRGELAPFFNLDEDDFQRRFIEPAKQRFQNQIAPEIQQRYIATGQQRSSGLEDALLKAGIDLDQAIESSYAGLRESKNANALSALGSALGTNINPLPQQYSFGQRLGQGLQGFLGSKSFEKTLDSIEENRRHRDILQELSAQGNQGGAGFAPYLNRQEKTRRGFVT